MNPNPGSNRRPLPSDLFHGTLNLRAASNVAFRYCRIRAALEAFTTGNQLDDRRRRRWRIGLYREIVCLSHFLQLFFDSCNICVARVQARHWGTYDLRLQRWQPFRGIKLPMVGYP